MPRIFQFKKQLPNFSPFWSLINKRSFFVISCIDHRLKDEVLNDIALRVFPEIYSFKQYPYKIPGADIDIKDKSTQSLLKAIKSMVENNRNKENLLLVIHNDCYAGEKNIINVPEDENRNKDYKAHINNKVLELLKYSDFAEMIEKDKLDFKATILYHQKTDNFFNKVESYKLNDRHHYQEKLNGERLDVNNILQFEKAFLVKKSEPERILFKPFTTEKLDINNILKNFQNVRN